LPVAEASRPVAEPVSERQDISPARALDPPAASTASDKPAGGELKPAAGESMPAAGKIEPAAH
jgi:hypothetical protein